MYLSLMIAWSDLFLDISYISSFVLDETRMIRNVLVKFKPSSEVQKNFLIIQLQSEYSTEAVRHKLTLGDQISVHYQSLSLQHRQSPFIEVKNGIFIVMGFFDILGTFRIFLCGGMLYRFSQKLYTQGMIKNFWLSR